MSKYRCTYEYRDDGYAKCHTWTCVGANGGLHLYIREPHSAYVSEGLQDPSGGIEVHYRYPPEYMADDAPSHDECWVLKCPCWHDGSSLQASERWIPMWELDRNDHEGIFNALRGEMATRFADVGFLARLAKLKGGE